MKIINSTFSEKIKIVDVGARFGINTPWDQLDSNLIEFMGFEPDLDECNKLNAENNNNNCRFMPVGLSDSDQKNILYITEQPGCSSIFKPNIDFTNTLYQGEQFNVVNEIQIKTVPLYKVLNEQNFYPDFLKIDAQGAAYDILLGAGEFLENILMLEIEVEFNSVYLGEKLFSSVDQLLMCKNFQILDINRYYGKRKILPDNYSVRGQVIFGDVIYFLPINIFIEKFQNIKDFKSLTKKYATMLSLYGYFDIALELIYHEISPLNDNEKIIFKNKIFKKSKISWLIIFLFNNRFSNLIGQILLIIGNSLMISSRISGWGSDYLNEDSRYKYYRNGFFSKYFKK